MGRTGDDGECDAFAIDDDDLCDKRAQWVCSSRVLWLASNTISSAGIGRREREEMKVIMILMIW